MPRTSVQEPDAHRPRRLRRLWPERRPAGCGPDLARAAQERRGRRGAAGRRGDPRHRRLLAPLPGTWCTTRSWPRRSSSRPTCSAELGSFAAGAVMAGGKTVGPGRGGDPRRGRARWPTSSSPLPSSTAPRPSSSPRPCASARRSRARARRSGFAIGLEGDADRVNQDLPRLQAVTAERRPARRAPHIWPTTAAWSSAISSEADKPAGAPDERGPARNIPATPLSSLPAAEGPPPRPSRRRPIASRRRRPALPSSRSGRRRWSGPCPTAFASSSPARPTFPSPPPPLIVKHRRRGRSGGTGGPGRHDGHASWSRAPTAARPPRSRARSRRWAARCRRRPAGTVRPPL